MLSSFNAKMNDLCRFICAIVPDSNVQMRVCADVQIIYRFIEGWQKNCTCVFEINNI